KKMKIYVEWCLIRVQKKGVRYVLSKQINRVKKIAFLGLFMLFIVMAGVMIPTDSVEAADVRIFIDPGHGGSDPGAAANGLEEKNVTLDIALKTRDMLNEQYGGHTIKLSRTTDVTRSLAERTNMANNWGANFFMSIHINSSRATGFESYTFDGNYADKERTNAIRSSIHNEIVRQTGFIDRGKKEENFHVLRESSAPAILTENGFIDNA